MPDMTPDVTSDMTPAAASGGAPAEWFAHPPARDGRLNLLCFPYAGGSSAIFSGWRRRLPDWINVCPVVLPGRDSRRLERRETDFSVLARRLSEAVTPAVAGTPFAVFGHSLGGWLAHEAAVAAARAGAAPLCLCVSGQRAPHLPYPFPPCDALSDEQLLSLARSWGGMEAALLDNPEWRRWLLAALRDDLRLCETHPPAEGAARLDCPLYAFGGRSDPLIRAEEILGWRRWTSAAFDVAWLDGGHFFLRERETDFLALLSARLADGLAARRPARDGAAGRPGEPVRVG